MVNKEKEAMLIRLREHLARKDAVKLITPDEYIAVKEVGSFYCPNGWHPPGCDGASCPRQPDPCQKCVVHRKLGRALEKHSAIPDDLFQKIIKPCQTCNKKTEWMEEPTYYEICMEARRARFVVDEVVRGKIAVVSNGNGWTIPV